MDAFFASVEQRDNPDLRGKPIAVGGMKRGVVAAASYEARQYGVRSAMPSVIAKRKCPDLIFVKHRFEVYREVSKQVRAIFFQYTDLVEPLSLDEAYLDVTENKKDIESAILIARQIRKKIYDTTQLTASAGVSINKFLAKVASDINKPNGMKVILPDEAEAFLEQLDIAKFFGIGKVTAKKMRLMGINTGADLKKRTEIELVQRFGKAGRFYYNIVRGVDNRKVNPNRIRKSIGAERTFNNDLTSLHEMEERLEKITRNLFKTIKKLDNYGRTVTVKIKFANFEVITRSKTYSKDITSEEELVAAMKALLKDNMESDVRVRLLGISVSNLQREKDDDGLPRQLEFDFDY